MLQEPQSEGAQHLRLPPIQSGEILSCWLARSAITLGCDPLTLTSVIWPGWRPWTVDIDRGLSQEHRDTLHLATGESRECIERASLRRWLAATGALCGPSEPHWPWLISRGGRNRCTFTGFPFCSVCLAQDRRPFYRVWWRFAWHVGCAHHRVLLHDHCFKCGSVSAPFIAASRHRDLTACWRCQADLRQAPTLVLHPSALSLMELADEVLRAGGTTVHGSYCSSTEWFPRVRAIASCRWSDIAAGGLEPPRLRSNLRLELQNVQERHLRMQHLFGALHMTATVEPTPDELPPASRLKKAAARRRTDGARSTPRSPQAVRSDWARLLRRLRQNYAS